MGKRIKRFLPLLVFGLFSPIPVLAQVEGPVETGLAQLAQQIVTKSAAAGKTTVAVLPFPNVDGSCSVLSNFIADELIQSLFSVPGAKPDIVERAQLETIINELKLGASGLLNPETTKRLGSQSGVSALIVGTITVIGDTVRINARLIATDTGKAISAAAVDIPKVAAVSELLKQPISSGPTCAPQRAGPAPAATTSQSPEEQNHSAQDVHHTSGLSLDVYLIQASDNLPERPTGISLASIHDERMPQFGYGAVLEERELAPYRDVHDGRRLGLHWSGKFQIVENGQYVFSLINTTAPAAQGNPCYVAVTLGNEQLFNGRFEVTNKTASFNREIALKKANYPFEVWMVCANSLWSSPQLTMRMRSPRDHTLSSVPSDLFASPSE